MGILALIAELRTISAASANRMELTKPRRLAFRFGPKSILTLTVIEKVKALREDGATVPEIMRRTKLSKASIYRALGGATHAAAG